MHSSSRWAVALTSIALLASAPALSAQWQSNTGPAGAVLGATVGGDVERYVRALALGGIIKPIAWGARPIGPREIAELVSDSSQVAHPWRRDLMRALTPRAALGVVLFTSENTGFPWGSNDGAMWQGRGLTGAIGASATVRWGHFSLIAAPLLFVAQNTSFPLLAPVVAGAPAIAEPLNPYAVDLPQRMGTSSYSRGDAGESTLRFDAGGVTAGITTASLGWGAGEAFPAIFGANAGGFPHVFVGTSARGIRIGDLGRVTGRYVLGVLEQSEWSPVQGSSTFKDRTESGTRRVGVGVSASFMPGALPNLELGVSRFYHSPYRDAASRWSAWSKPFEALYKVNFIGRTGGAGDPGGDADNQLASIYARWAFPSRGAEATIEILRDDHNFDARDLAQEPENNSAVLASIRAVTERTSDRLSVLTFEYFDGDVRPIAQARAQAFLYANSLLRQGHTLRGQLLGTPIGAGAIAGERVAWERFTKDGSLRVNLQRWRTRALPSDDPELLFRQPGQPAPNNHDFIIDAGVAKTTYRGTQALTAEIGVAWAGVWQFDGSRTNLYSRLSWSVF